MKKAGRIGAIRRVSRPHILVNFAMTLDGKISTRAKTPSTFTSAEDKKRLLEIRALGDAVMVGRQTVSSDQMSMGMPVARLQKERVARGQSPFPLRVVISPAGNFNPAWKIFHTPGGRVLLFGSAAMATRRRRELAALENTDLYTPAEFSLAEVLRTLKRKYQVQTLVCEGGPTLLRGLLELGAVDELYLTVAPRIFGGESAPTLTGLPGEFLSVARRFTLQTVRKKEGEFYLHYVRSPGLAGRNLHL
jgi:riboflavin-specific deaminase-like protein